MKEPLFVIVERPWKEVKPGDLVEAYYGIVKVKSIEQTPDGIVITPEASLPWTQDPSQTVSVAVRRQP